MEKHITVPFGTETVEQLKAGDYVYLTGTIYTARDAAIAALKELKKAGIPIKQECFVL